MAATVLGLLLVIGWIDYAAGFWVSMQLFYLVPIVLAVAWFGWRAGCGFAILAVLLRLAGDTAAGMFDQISTGSVLGNRAVEACISCILVWLFHALFSLQRELEERVRQRTASLEQANAARQELQRQLAEAGRRERSAIGHDLHDGLGQHLTATSMAANVLASRLAAAGHTEAEHARPVVELVQGGIAKTRRIARGLLLSAIEPDQLAAGIRREHGIACQFTLPGGASIATSPPHPTFSISRRKPPATACGTRAPAASTSPSPRAS